MNRTKFLMSVAVPLSLGALLVFTLLFSGGFVQADEVEATATPNDRILSAISREMDQTDAILKEEGLSDNQKAKYRAKKKNLEQKATERVDYLAHQDEALIQKQTAIVNMTLTPIMLAEQTSIPTPGGLYTEFMNPWPHKASFSTAWVVRTEDQHMAYFAGYLIEDADQGLMYVENMKDHSFQIVYTPDKDGRLKINEVKEKKIILESKKGKKYYFNIDKKIFVDELDNPLSEATQTPVPAYPVPAYPAP